ncbi:MAG: ribosome biogenesis GTPase, partial [Paracoccaceae bacterium]
MPEGDAVTEADRAAHLTALGWSDFFADQLSDDERDASPMRVSGVHRSRISAIGDAGPVRLEPHGRARAADFAVGDWVLADAQTRLIHRRLDRKTLLERHVEGGRVPQLIAANVDTLFIVTSCNADFNPARLERYLALANEAGTTPVILLTKADETSDAASFEDRAAALQRGLVAVSLNAKSPDAAKVLAPWIGPGQTIVLVGSSGVGKSTLLNTLAGPDQATPQATSGVREDDAKGRHTTTSRSLHATA